MSNTSIWIAAFLTLAFSQTALAADYLLASQDRVRVKVVEWRPGKSEYKEWETMTGEYLVGAGGSISLPLIGDIPVRGKTTVDVAAAISDALKSQMGMMKGPNASVEISQFRPIYVSGEVDKPGEYPFRPEINVLQVVSLAGGLHRENEAGLLRLERDRITASGLADAARLDLRRLMVRRERLKAELANKQEFDAPSELAGSADLGRLLSAERDMMTARSQALSSQLKALNELRLLYAAEVDSLARKTTTQQKQITLAKRELAGVNLLVGKGLAVTSRETSLERTVADLEGKLLDFETAALRAKQEINKAQRDAADLETNRRTSILNELQAAESEIDQSSSKMNTSVALIDEATVVAPRLVLDRSIKSRRTARYSIMRLVDDKSVETPAEETTQVKPGDIVRVVYDSSGDETASIELDLLTPSSVNSAMTETVARRDNLRSAAPVGGAKLKPAAPSIKNN